MVVFVDARLLVVWTDFLGLVLITQSRATLLSLNSFNDRELADFSVFSICNFELPSLDARVGVHRNSR